MRTCGGAGEAKRRKTARHEQAELHANHAAAAAGSAGIDAWQAQIQANHAEAVANLGSCSLGAEDMSYASRVSPYSEAEMVEAVEKALTRLFAGLCDEVSFDELFQQVGRDPRAAAAGKAAVTRVLDAMETANMVMHREGRVHLI